ncbi:MAG: DUF5671 domain-containing protein, partial [Acidimicrobiia bacterium]|nr:DUF5671 domain-containing protein [Acidimicrobiia bacterium]
SLAVATLVVAVPVAIVIWRALFAKSQDFARRLAVIGGLSVAMVTTLFSVVGFGRGLVVGDGFRPGSFSTLVAFGAAWAGYEWLRQAETEPFQVSDLRPTAGAGVGLVLSVSGMVLLIETALTETFGLGGDVILDRSIGERLGTVGVLLAVGLPALWWFWIRDLSTHETRFRNGYAAVVSYASLIALASSVGVVLFLALEWVLGFGEETASSQFEPIPISVAAGVIGAVSWLHHIDLLRPRRGLGTRAYGYGIAATAVGFVAGGLVTLISVALEAVASDTIVETDGAGSVTIGAILAVGLGAVLWWMTWSQADVTIAGERESVPRRLYLTGLLIVAGITGGVALVIALFGFVQAALEQELGRDVLFDGRFVIGLVLTTAPLIWHLLSEIRADREARPEHVRLREAIVIAGDRGPLGNGVHFVTRADGHGVITVDVAEQINTVLEQTGPPVVITVDDDGLRVVEVEAVP